MNWKGGISWTPQDAVAARKIALMTLYISHRAVAWKTPLQEASIVCPVASLNVLFASGVYEKGQARRKNRGFLGRLGFRGGCPHRGHSFADSCRVISNWTPKGETYRSHCAICKWCIREKIKQGARIEDSWIDCHRQSHARILTGHKVFDAKEASMYRNKAWHGWSENVYSETRWHFSLCK